MMTLKINGREEQFNIGCRTFIALNEMLGILKSDAPQVTLNGETVSGEKFADITVKGGDDLVLK